MKAKAVTALLLGVAMVLPAAAVSAAANAASGNAQAIAFYKASQTAMSKAKSIELVETGYVSMRSELGKQSSFSWIWGSGAVPKNWVPATMQVTVGQSGGKVTWVAAELTSAAAPPHCAASVKVCIGADNGQPFEVVVNASGVAGRFIGVSSSCYLHIKGESPWVLGDPWVGVYGVFRPMVPLGGAVEVTSVYKWGSSQSATETDTIARTHRWISSTVHVSAGKSTGELPFTFDESGYRYVPETEPKVTYCASQSAA